MKATINLARNVIKIYIFLFCFFSGNLRAQLSPSQTVSVLSIGNAYYKYPDIFESYPDINYSAEEFLNCFKNFGTLCIMEARTDKILTRQKMLQVIQNFIDFVEQKKGDKNIGIIYYCGHGMANLAGSMYFIPGDIDINGKDTTFEYLSQKLLNVDEINKLIIEAQSKGISRSQYIILGDCCTDKVKSKWYQGITFSFPSDAEGTVTYDSVALANMSPVNSSLSASLNATYDSTGYLVPLHADSAKPTINEFNFISELIRSTTVKKNGNMSFYSSPIGTTVGMVDPPNSNSKGLQVGPICRRTILYFKKNESLLVNDYLNKLTKKDFDPSTSPALLNRSRANN